jgi:formylglycine-generating enzyme required for sulfatase activity
VPAFRIDRTEVRVSEYRHCVDDGACEPPAIASGCNWNAPGRSEHPVNCIDWDQAASYCGWVGKRLPTEQEWEKAARGTDGRIYPWGNEGASCDVAVMRGARGSGCGESSTAPVGSRDRGRSPYGLFDMAGNVHEWTGSVYESGGGARVLRGGSWQNDATAVRSSHREGALPNLRDASIGFRCAQGAVVAESRSR